MNTSSSILHLIESLLKGTIFNQWKTSQLIHSPYIVFDCDQTLIQGDIGELLFGEVLGTGHLKSHDAFWDLFPSDQGITLKSEYETWTHSIEYQSAFSNTHQSDIPLHSSWIIPSSLFITLWNAYETVCSTDINKGYLLASQCFTGWTVSRTRQYCKTLFERSCQSTQVNQNPLSNCSFSFPTSICPYPQQKQVIQHLKQAGCLPWIVSSSPQWIVEEVGTHMGISPAHTIGVQFETQWINEQEYVTSIPLTPIPINQDKKAAFEAKIHPHISPFIMIGDSIYDFPLMQASKFGILIDYGIETLRQKADALGIYKIPATSLLTSP